MYAAMPDYHLLAGRGEPYAITAAGTYIRVPFIHKSSLSLQCSGLSGRAARDLLIGGWRLGWEVNLCRSHMISWTYRDRTA
jgi:hypothetical protein